MSNASGGAHRLWHGIPSGQDLERGCLSARQHVHRQPGIGQQGTVRVVRRAVGVLWGVAVHRHLQLATQTYHRGIQIKNPRRDEQWLRCLRLMQLEPGTPAVRHPPTQTSTRPLTRGGIPAWQITVIGA